MESKDTFEGIPFPKGLAPHQIEAIKNGGSAPDPQGGPAVTLESLGFDPASLAGVAVDASAALAQAKDRIAALECEVADLTAKLAKAQKPLTAAEKKAQAEAEEAQAKTDAEATKTPEVT